MAFLATPFARGTTAFVGVVALGLAATVRPATLTRLSGPLRCVSQPRLT